MKKSVRSCEKHIYRYISYEKIRLFNNDQLIACPNDNTEKKRN